MVARHTVRAYLDLTHAEAATVGGDVLVRITVSIRGETAATKIRAASVQVDRAARLAITNSDFLHPIRKGGQATFTLTLSPDFRLANQARIDLSFEYDDIFDQAWRARYHLISTGDQIGQGRTNLGRREAGEKPQSEG